MNSEEGNLNVNVNSNELTKVLKDYKKIKKYMRSSIFEIKKMDGNEKTITKLMKQLENM